MEYDVIKIHFNNTQEEERRKTQQLKLNNIIALVLL